MAAREEEVDRNVRINLQLQEDVAAARKDVDERTTALTSAITVRPIVHDRLSGGSWAPVSRDDSDAACTITE